MKVVEIGASAYEVQKNGVCLFAGTMGECDKFFKKKVPKKAKPALERRSTQVEGDDA